MTLSEDVFVTSRSRAPSIIDVKSENERVFAQLPDLIQEAAMATECKWHDNPWNLRLQMLVSNPNLLIKRVDTTDEWHLTKPMFLIAPKRDSGISLPDINITDEKFLAKYGSDLSANYADIKTLGERAFLPKLNPSNGVTYSLCTCATGYIWVSVRFLYEAQTQGEYSDIEVQIGTFALKARVITTVEVPCQYISDPIYDDLCHGRLALLCSTVIGKYLQLRMLGQQYECATEISIKNSREELSAMRIVDPGRFGNFGLFLKEICANTPLPPTSAVSLISRNMITGRWKGWTPLDKSAPKKRYSFIPKQILWTLQYSKHDSLELLKNSIKPSIPNK